MTDVRSCGLSSEALVEFLFEDISEQQRVAVERHLRECPACREELAGLRDGVRAYVALGEEQTSWTPERVDPTPVPLPPAKRSWVIRGAVAAAVAILAIVVLWQRPFGPSAPVSRAEGGSIPIDGELVAWRPDGALIIDAPPGAVHEIFGEQLALADGRLAVAALPGLEGEALGQGTSHVYLYRQEPGGWRLTESLAGPEAEPFGQGLAVSERYLVVGTPSRTAPRVYLYRRESGRWLPDGVITDPGAEPGSDFGLAVALSGDRLIIGARRAMAERDGEVGRAYVYQRGAAGWSLEAELVPDRLAEDANYGYAVDIDGDHAIVGARGEDYTGPLAGSVFFFEAAGGGWRQTARFGSGSGVADFLGVAVAIDGDTAAAGAEYARGREAAGAIHTYHRVEGGWQQTGVLAASADRIWLGRALALRPGLLVAGNRLSAGALIYRRVDGEWNLQRMATPPPAVLSGGPSLRLAVGADVVAVVARPSDEAAPGQVVLYRLPDPAN